MHWSFPNKVSAIPHFLSYKAAQDDMPRRSVCDYPLVSSGLMPMSNADAIESNQKPHSGVVQVCYCLSLESWFVSELSYNLQGPAMNST